jgi:hypothetical protein
MQGFFPRKHMYFKPQKIRELSLLFNLHSPLEHFCASNLALLFIGWRPETDHLRVLDICPLPTASTPFTNYVWFLLNLLSFHPLQVLFNFFLSILPSHTSCQEILFGWMVQDVWTLKALRYGG